MRAAQEAKQAEVQAMKQIFADSQASYVVDYQGCGCSDLTGLRAKLKPTGAKFTVVKNTLARRAVEDTEAAGLTDLFKGPTAIIWSKEDPVTPAKALKDFAKEKEAFEIKGGFVDGEVLDASGVGSIASLPSKEELLAKLLALISAPATRLLQTINAPGTNLVRLLGAVKDKKEQEGS